MSSCSIFSACSLSASASGSSKSSTIFSASSTFFGAKRIGLFFARVGLSFPTACVRRSGDRAGAFNRSDISFGCRFRSESLWPTEFLPEFPSRRYNPGCSRAFEMLLVAVTSFMAGAVVRNGVDYVLKAQGISVRTNIAVTSAANASNETKKHSVKTRRRSLLPIVHPDSNNHAASIDEDDTIGKDCDKNEGKKQRIWQRRQSFASSIRKRSLLNDSSYEQVTSY